MCSGVRSLLKPLIYYDLSTTNKLKASAHKTFWMKLKTSPVPKVPLTPSLLYFSPAGVAGQKVRVEEELEAYPNESVDLRCMFVDGLGTKLTQVRKRGVTC